MSQSQLASEKTRVEIPLAGRAAAWARFERLGLAFALVMLVVAGSVVVWYTSIGLFPTFPKVHNQYVTLAQAFLHGQVSLLETPPPELVALENPYDMAARKDIPHQWDASYYQGKYYFYWGPVPALFFAAWIALTGVEPLGQMGVIIPALGLLAVLLYLVWQIRRAAYPRSPVVIVGLFLLVAAINTPMLFLYDRARIYETSIIAGQFFLFLGTAGWVTFLQSRKNGWLVLAGLGWGLALLTRYNLALSVLVYLAFCLPVLWKPRTGWNERIRPLSALLAPLAVCGLSMLAYNAARFDNPLETGLQYQLTNMVETNGHFSPVYFLSNVFLYFLFPYIKVEHYPVIRSILDVAGQAPAWAAFPADKMNDEVIFSLRTVPFTWLLAPLLLLVGAVWLASRRKGRLEQPAANAAVPDLWPRLGWMIALGGLAQLLLLMFYYFTAVRFMVDFLMPWLLVVLFLLWEVDRRLADRRLWWLRLLLWAAVLGLILWTAQIGFFAAIDNPPRPFGKYNPALDEAMAETWNRYYDAPGIVGMVLRRAVWWLP